MGFEIDDIMNDTVMEIPREELENILSSENSDEKKASQETEDK